MWKITKATLEYDLKYPWKRWKTRDFDDEQSVEGKVVIVTGANSGIGKATTMNLAERGATVIMACRQLQRAQAAVNDIRRQTENGELIMMKLDLADLDSIRDFVKDFSEKFDHLNILINNAGIADTSAKPLKTKDGFELHFGTNHLGHFLLTNLLLDALRRGAPSRVILVSSMFYSVSKLNMDDLMLAKVKGFEAVVFPYGNSKLANLLLIKTLAQKMEGTAVTAYALCPGLVKTSIFDDIKPWYIAGYMYLWVKLFGFSNQKGCQTTLHCALSSKLASESGKMYRFERESKHVMEKFNEGVANELWNRSEELVGLNSIQIIRL